MVPAGSDGANRASARADGPERIDAHNPVHYVEGVDILLGDYVAGEDIVESPGAEAVFGIIGVGPPGIVHSSERAACVIDCLAEGNVAQGACVDALEGLDIKLVGAGLKIDEETELLRGGFFAGIADAQAAGRIDGYRLSDIDVLAGIHGSGGLLGMEIGRGLNRNGIDLFDELAIAG